MICVIAELNPTVVITVTKLVHVVFIMSRFK